MPISSSNVRPRIALSRQEMCIISQNISRDFSPRLFASRTGRRAKNRFTPSELLEISRQISREYAPNKVTHQARLVLLAVSPRRLHVYWHLAKRRLTEAANQPDPAPALVLRIYADNRTPHVPAQQPAADQPCFDVKLDSLNGQQDVWLPEALANTSAIRYRAALGEIADEQVFIPRVYSNAAQTPSPVKPESRENPPNAMVPFIMPALNTASSAGKTASGQGK